MKLAVLGQAARDVGVVAARHPNVSTVVPVDAGDDLGGGNWLGVIVSGEVDGGVKLSRNTLASGRRVLLAGVPTNDDADWSELAADAPDGLTLSRPLRFDPHIARAIDVVRAGTIGSPRTLELDWTFSGEIDATAAAAELVDAACVLLDGGPAAIYAIACGVAGPPLVKVNLLTTTGGIAAIEAAGETSDFPARRDLHLLGTDGEIVHRIGQDDLLWSDGSAEPLPGAPRIDELRAREIAAWLDGGGESPRLARGTAVGWNLLVARALARALATGDVVRIGEGVA